LFHLLKLRKGKTPMTLEEVVYQIDGKIETGQSPAEDGAPHTIKLLDNTGDVAVVNLAGEEARPQANATAAGKTPEEARQKLVALLKGGILLHDWPVMWKTHTTSLRIPETLTA
jgi:hypothetical protein